MLKDLITTHPTSLSQHKVWSKAHILWFHEPLQGPTDIRPKRRHYVKALLLFLLENNYMVKELDDEGKPVMFVPPSGTSLGRPPE